MKKVFLLALGGIIAVGANAQYAKQTNQSLVRKMEQTVPVKKAVQGSPFAAARTTAATFYTQTFGGGIPSGWTTGVITGGTWKWTMTASTSPFTMGAMASTTAANGWMIFDSDSIGSACSCAPAGWVQSDALDCSTHTSVRLNFENYFRKFQDSCAVWVSTSPTFAPGTYTAFPVVLNNNLAVNVSTANPSIVHINISSVAAGSSTVYIRFVSFHGASGGSYSWMVDDMTLSELDPVDLGVSEASMMYYGGANTGLASFGSKPLKMMDTVFPAAFASNYGSTPALTASVDAKIFQGSTSVYSNTASVVLPVNAMDSFVNYLGMTGYLPNANGNYIMPFAISATGDADPINDVDTTAFTVTDSMWSQNGLGKSLLSALTVYNTASGGNPALAYSPATGFAVTAGRVDTLTSISVCFNSQSTVGQIVGVQIYHFDAGSTTWIYDGLTKFRALTAADISTSSSLVWANFKTDIQGMGSQIVLDGGTAGTTYVAVVKGQSNSNKVFVNQTTSPAPYDMIGATGYADTSNNDGGASQQFGQGHLPFLVESAPMIALNFGKVDYTVGLHDVSGVLANVGKAYPNPANNTVSIPFTIEHNATVNVTVSNVVGQVVKTQSVAAIGGQATKATFNTSDLANGVYIYDVEVEGQHHTGRMAVTR